MSKLSVIGAGNVGATAAFQAAQKQLAEEIVLIDIVEGLPDGKGLDMQEAGSIEKFDSHVQGGTDPTLLKDSDVIIVTSGIARKPGMSREDLLKTNAGIIKSVTNNIKTHAPNAIIIMVSNPLDIMTFQCYQVSGFPKNRVIGQAGVLDSARFKAFLAEELKVSVEDISTMVLGGHGDTMVPLLDYTCVSGIPVRELMKEDKLQALVERTRKGGAEIVGLLKTGSAFYAPGCAAVQMAESILLNKRRVLPASCLLEGEYGIDGIYSGVPCILGSNGLEKIIELKLSDEDLASLQKSANNYKEIAGGLKDI